MYIRDEAGLQNIGAEGTRTGEGRDRGRVRLQEHRTIEDDKELKVRIPVQQHLMLHSLKVLTGKSISDAVSEALAAYFAGTAHERATADSLPPAEDVAHAHD